MTDRKVKIRVGYKARPWQAKVHRQLRRFSVLVVHRRGGKTVMSISELTDKAVQCAKKNGRYGYISPILKQSKRVAWTYLKDQARNVPGTKINEAELYVEFSNGARITLYGADNPDSIRGEYFDGVVLDEYADMKEIVWKDVVRPMLADRRGWAIFIGTPKGHDNFFEMYRLAVRRMEAGKNWYATLLPHWETGVLDPQELEEAREEMGDKSFEREMCCDFSVEGDDILIPIKLVEEAIGKHYDKTIYSKAARVMGVDVARFGDDRSVIQKRQGLHTHEPIVLKGLDNMELADRVAAEINHFEPDAVFIDLGQGQGVIDRLRQLGYSVIGVNFGGKSTSARYANKATEMWANTLKALKDGLALPPGFDEYLTELSGRTYSFLPTGAMIIEPKDKMKERFRSPDLADALVLTYAQPVAPKVDILDHVPQINKAAGLEYDPF